MHMSKTIKILFTIFGALLFLIGCDLGATVGGLLTQLIAFIGGVFLTLGIYEWIEKLFSKSEKKEDNPND